VEIRCGVAEIAESAGAVAGDSWLATGRFARGGWLVAAL